MRLYAPPVGPRVLLRAALVVFMGGGGSPASAHDFWIEPQTFTPAVASVLEVGLRVGKPFLGEPVPRDPEHVRRFAWIGPLGGRSAEDEVAGVAGWDPAGLVRMTNPGLHALVYRSAPTDITLPAVEFEAYLKDQALDSVVQQRTARGESALPGRERFQRCAKALLEVTSGADGAVPAAGEKDRALGLTLELVAETNPYALRAGDELGVVILYRGAPLSHTRLTATSSHDPTVHLAAWSDEAGHARLALQSSGPWLVTALHMVPAPASAGADWESFWASLSFALPERRGEPAQLPAPSSSLEQP